MEEVLNNTFKSAIAGGFTGFVTGGVSGAIGKAGFSGEVVAGLLGFGFGASASAINTHYDIFKPARTESIPTFEQIKILNPSYKPLIAPQVPTIIPWDQITKSSN